MCVALSSRLSADAKLPSLQQPREASQERTPSPPGKASLSSVNLTPAMRYRGCVARSALLQCLWQVLLSHMSWCKPLACCQL